SRRRRPDAAPGDRRGADLRGAQDRPGDEEDPRAGPDGPRARRGRRARARRWRRGLHDPAVPRAGAGAAGQEDPGAGVVMSATDRQILIWTIIGTLLVLGTLTFIIVANKAWREAREAIARRRRAALEPEIFRYA